MTAHGAKLKQYVDDNGVIKTKLAKDLKMSPQNLYQLFKSRAFEKETIERIEKALKVKWKDIDTINIDTNESTPSQPKAEPGTVDKLADSNQKLADSIFDMVQMLKKREEDAERLKANLNQVLLNQYATAAADREYQAYVIEAFWKIQGKKVEGREVVKELNQKATDKFVQMQTQGIQLD